MSNLCNPSDAVRTMNKPDQRCPNWSALNRSKELLNSSFIKFCSVRIGIQNLKNLCFRSVRTELWKQNVQPGPNRIRFPLNRTESVWSPWNRTETVRSDHTGPVAERTQSVPSKLGTSRVNLCSVKPARCLPDRTLCTDLSPGLTDLYPFRICSVPNIQKGCSQPEGAQSVPN